jgi:hypothetical protein
MNQALYAHMNNKRKMKKKKRKQQQHPIFFWVLHLTHNPQFVISQRGSS